MKTTLTPANRASLLDVSPSLTHLRCWLPMHRALALVALFATVISFSVPRASAQPGGEAGQSPANLSAAVGFDTRSAGCSNGRRNTCQARFHGVAYGGGTFVAVGSKGAVLASTDGVEWSEGSAGIPFSLYAVAYGAGRFVAVGNEGAVASSTDGLDWTVQNAGTDERLRGISYGHGLFVAVGYSGVILTSSDGTKWAKRDSKVDDRLQGVAFGEDRFVAAGWNGCILTSKDGAHWKKSRSTGEDLAGVSYGEAGFTALSSSGPVLTSTDGVAWARTEESNYLAGTAHIEAKVGFKP